ncbi:MAG: hypothetical protein Q4F71_02610 [Paracoccus sp. (in: a-proteobacteria)]|nr:hypothetical protein [Paracoccus sp. (in: a-proteobacteria)]
MTNSIALLMALLIGGVLAVDHYWLGGDMPLFLARQFVNLVEYLSFWR